MGGQKPDPEMKEGGRMMEASGLSEKLKKRRQVSKIKKFLKNIVFGKAQIMKWEKLLNSERLGKQTSTVPADSSSSIRPERSEFQKDFDRIAFSSAFRRLQDKAQVIPLADSDYPRTRMIHSLEVSTVGRSLGIIVGKTILRQNADLERSGIFFSDFGAIVAAACLGHDIGHPPFGHSGELAIRQWFSHSETGKKTLKRFNNQQKNDFLKFEGNAQGFRILTRLQWPNTNGGLQLTYATLGAFLKYPINSCMPDGSLGKNSRKKHGYFYQDQNNFEKVANELGLKKINGGYCRHPLAFLVEAADDITYLVIDVEDAFLLDNITYEEADRLLLPIAGNNVENHDKYLELKGKWSESKDDIQKRKDIGQELIELLRAKAIGNLIEKVSEVFCEKEKEILEGAFDADLLGKTGLENDIKKIREFSKKRIYKSKQVLEVEAPGFNVISGLLEAFVPSVINVDGSSRENVKSETIRNFMIGCLGMQQEILNSNDDYKKLLSITDFVSGMTDTYAVSIFKRLTGFSLR